jgi:hypothetical protein
MQRFGIAVSGSILVSASIFGALAPARAQTYPVCLAGGDTDTPRCDYATLEQCKAAASGIGYCITIAGSSSGSSAAARPKRR